MFAQHSLLCWIIGIAASILFFDVQAIAGTHKFNQKTVANPPMEFWNAQYSDILFGLDHTMVDACRHSSILPPGSVGSLNEESSSSSLQAVAPYSLFVYEYYERKALPQSGPRIMEGCRETVDRGSPMGATTSFVEVHHASKHSIRKSKSSSSLRKKVAPSADFECIDTGRTWCGS